MAAKFKQKDLVRERLGDEVGRLEGSGPCEVALVYPSPYHVAMSSLGFQTIYRRIQSSGKYSCERFFAPDLLPAWTDASQLVSYETASAISAFPVIAFSIAYELEIAGFLTILQGARIPLRNEERSNEDPLIVVGGPLTFSNPLPFAPFADVIVMGEADSLISDVLDIALSEDNRQARLEKLACLDHVLVPSLMGERLVPLAQAEPSLLPAWSPIRTPNTELRNMLLIEAVRGCSRGCRYCVMRRSTNSGMRIIPIEKILSLIPDDANRVGLVGASVSDHPNIVELLNALADKGKHVGLSSMRADRMKMPFVQALKRVGYKTLTTAMDGSSERVRAILDRRTTAEELSLAIQNAREVKLERVKLYLMIGVPGETEEDIDECAQLVREFSKILPTSLGIAPFCAKRNTPLDGSPFAGIGRVDKMMAHLRKKIAGKVELRAMSSRWAWIEYVLAQGAGKEGLAALEAVINGARFADYRAAFGALGHDPEASSRRDLPILPSA